MFCNIHPNLFFINAPSIKSIAIAVILLTFSLTTTNQCHANPMIRSASTREHSITLYTDANFKGVQTTIHMRDSCVNLSGMLNDAASSLDAGGGCVIICESSYCRGRCEEVKYFSSDLSKLGLNDAVSSIQPCFI